MFECMIVISETCISCVLIMYELISFVSLKLT